MTNSVDAPGAGARNALTLSGAIRTLAAGRPGAQPLSGTYELAVAFANSGSTWTDFLAGQVGEHTEVPYEAQQLDGVPFLPTSPGMSAVYSFGYTHTSVNDIRVEKGNLDFYHKGPGELLITDGETLTGTSLVVGGGIEVEYCAIYCVNERGEAVYLGHTLANDFSDAGLRHAHRNLANLSKLHPSVLSLEVILEDLPPLSAVGATVERDGSLLWKRKGELGTQALLYSRRLMERLLFRRSGLFHPGAVVYLLLGSCISSHKDGVELRDGDLVTIRDSGSGLSLTNHFHC
ncbi:hypothetical protein ACIBCO_24270 [Streptomyces violascens]|uniref:hypothetical protein n=1 Tax=Streptomyces violascens TaxID=67381 RepID=UPI0037B570C2